MSRRGIHIIVAVVLIALIAGSTSYYTLRLPAVDVTSATEVATAARIDPDYSGITIPPNIAPLNFFIDEPGMRYFVQIGSANGEDIEVSSRDGRIVIPPKQWRRLLEANRGRDIYFHTYIQRRDGTWYKYKVMTNTIASEDIDNHLVYRLMNSIYNVWRNVGIYQRNLESFDESVVLHSSSFGAGCVNCHTLRRNNPADMLLNVRPGAHAGPKGGMLVVRNGAVASVVNTKTQFNPIPAIYLAWHPSGRIMAFSTNRIRQFFHSRGENRDVFDHYSNLAIYNLDTNTVTSNSRISTPDRMETYPQWSPDGKSLYFCSAPQRSIRNYRNVRYDLMRIGYDLETDTWTQTETVLAANELGLSITHPRISPDGRWLLFCACKYGNFSIYQPSSDLYMMDLQTGKYRRLDINSDKCESWHCWSSNGKWIVFSSKRRDGLLAKPYFSYVEDTGKARKPFLLPQADPKFYDSFVKTYNVPQFATGPVPVSQRQLAKALHSAEKQVKAKLDPAMATRVPSGVEAENVPYKPGPGG